MEAVEELPMHIPGFEGVIDNLANMSDANTTEFTKDCHKTNGVSGLPSALVDHVADSNMTEPPQFSHLGTDSLEVGEGLEHLGKEISQMPEEQVITNEVIAESSLNEPSTADSGIDTANERVDVDSSNISEFDVENSECAKERTIVSTELDDGTVLDSTDDNLKLQTAIHIDQEETVISTTIESNKILHYDNESDNKILSELDGHSLDLSEALGTPEVHDGSENHNSDITQEVFNKEELLDILEGNEPEQEQNVAQRALQQLTKLAKDKRRKTFKKSAELSGKSKKVEKQPLTKPAKHLPQKQTGTKSVPVAAISKPKEENIVKALVDDWEDDEPEDEKSKKLLQESEQLQPVPVEVVSQQEVPQDGTKPPLDSTLSEESVNKSSDEGPLRRLGRVIKKKVIFDPDNPDTFTKGKTVKSKELQSDKETPPPPKKVKPDQAALRATSKSPVNKTNWKKPIAKKSIQKHRLSEVDKLLMDEGAVNMMYQLTPEAPKGRKNMRTKAEFIKKINQSSTPDAKEMKFRERKKDLPKEEGEGKRGLRTSLSGSIKSTSVGEDFENTSADDSIIYRRHSSSSYSSTCLSPRRLSDVESNTALPVQTVAQALQQTAESISAMVCEPTENGQPESKEVFMADDHASPVTPETIKKKDCLSLKEKLNSKLSNALNKRKREIKTDKPMKQKKLTPKVDKNKETILTSSFKNLTISFNDRVAEISMEKSGSPKSFCSLEIILELKQALELINTRKETSVTLLASEIVLMCSKLNLKPLLETNMEKKISNALEITSATRSLLSSVEEHSKVLVCGADGACSGLALAIVALCDAAVASEGASFALATARNAPPVPGVAALSSPYSRLSPALVHELVICGRRLSGSEAMERGLVTRALWTAGFTTQLRGWVTHLAAQPAQGLLLKKKLLRGKGTASKSTFQEMLAAEQDQLSAYWGSMEGQESLRAHYAAA